METTKLAKEICPTLTLDKVEKGALLVDVREIDEINQVSFDVPDVLFIPISEFENRWEEIPKDREVVLVCQVGARSLKATYYLMNHGYNNVFNMEYGIEKWVKKGFPIKGSLKVKSSNSSCCGSSTDASNTSCCDSSQDSSGGCC